jgi:hypothetical protein
MPKWQISLTRDASQDASVIIEAETAEKAEQIFHHDVDRDAVEWTEGDWLGDTEIVEVLPADDNAELTSLETLWQKPGPDAGEIGNEIRQILDDNDAGKGRVFLDPEDVLRLRGFADRLGVIASQRTTL